MASLSLICCYAVAAGVASHLGYFIHGEHHSEGPVIATLFMLSQATILGVQVRFLRQDLVVSMFRTAIITATYLSALFSSMLIYRLFFHRLRHFPGPPAAKVSKIWHTIQAFPRLDSFRWLTKVHEQYGDYVRTGPNELSIYDPDAIPAILGPRFSRGPWYDSTLPLVSMQTVRDKQIHLQRRRIWDKGINAKALRLYEERVLDQSELFVKQVAARAGQVFEARDWFKSYSFDIMGAIAFGKTFGTLDQGANHFALDILSKGHVAFGLLSYIPWAIPLLNSLPGSPLHTFIEWMKQLLKQRQEIQSNAEAFDVMGHLIQAYNEGDKSDLAFQYLAGDTRLIILAGTDTTAATLTNIFYILAKFSVIQTKLRAELEPLVPEDKKLCASDVQDALYLNGIIDETLRLHPVGLSGMSRLSPPEGIMVNNTFIPGNVTVYTPNCVVFRHPAAFEMPDEFIPERWYERPELVKKPKAFAPWSLGPTACAGKALALLELRILVTLLVTKFHISFAPGDDGSSVVQQVTDHFVSTPGPLKLVFTPLKNK